LSNWVQRFLINVNEAAQEQQQRPQQKEPPPKESPPIKTAQQPKTNEPIKTLPQDSSTVPPVPSDSSPGSPGSGAGNNGASQGGNKGLGLGSGEGFVLSQPVTYPKNAQNEGSEGEVLTEVRLTPEGEIQVVLLSASGDQRLDSYSLRALKEAWQYTRPAFPVKIKIALIFRSGEVKVVFQGSEQWERSEAQP